MNNAWQVARTLFLRLRFIFVFIAIGLVVGHWAWIQNVADRLTRPRLSYNVAVYHRTLNEEPA